MDKPTFKRGSLQSVGSRLVKPRRSKSSKASRDSKGSATISTIREVDHVDEAEATNYRESITNLFFESFLETIIAERTAITSESSLSSLSGAIESSTESYESYLECVTEIASGTTLNKVNSKSQKSNLMGIKDPSTQKYSHFSQSTQSVPDSASTKENSSYTSCASNCLCNWRIVFKNGNIYEGQTNGTLMHGKGTFYWADGSIYKGDFKDGFCSGTGKVIVTDLSTYEGEFCMGFFHGQGTFNIKCTPFLYSGQWKYNERSGKGWQLYESNNFYEGDWAYNRRHGYGFRQYSDGTRYKGYWLNDKIDGEGCIIWSNNDYYTGEWSNGYQHGYGEYTWCLIAHEKLIFPNYNWYKGNWVKGCRSGAGIMNFGHTSGAKLAGTWERDRKHGPGLMICGNGIFLQKNPLFKDDKPAPYQKRNKYGDVLSYTTSENDYMNVPEPPTLTYKTISEQIKSKDNLTQLYHETINKISKSGTSIKMNQYIKLLEKNTGNAPPLKIPIHNIIHEVDLNYFVSRIQQGYIPQKESHISALEINQMLNCKTPNLGPTPSNINYIPSNCDLSLTRLLEPSLSLQCLPNANELKNLIINHLPQLRTVYKKYASLCAVGDELTFEPVLVRLFLWQLYRDIGVTDKNGVSIVEIDEMLVDNPKSCLDTVHNPWEPIYFWQFLQALVGVACLLYSQAHHADYIPTNGFMYRMFKSFLDNKLFPNAGRFKGNCLTHLKDFVPITSAYQLYKEVGEPHTVEEFLKNCCLKKGRRPPCYKIINNDNNDEYVVQTGTNIVCLNNEVLFSEKTRSSLKYNNNTRYEQQGLYTFTNLGRKQILKSLARICPQIIADNKNVVFHYRLSFIEFYEAILVLAYEKVEHERLKLVTESTKGPSLAGVKISKIYSREISRMSQLRRRKTKK